jgi:DNA-binding NarL/FixJ family response regulator
MPQGDRTAKLPAPPVRVLVADDHPLTRVGIGLALEGEGFEVCAEAGDADGAVEAAVRERPDLCLLDVSMPGGGIRAAEMILDRVPESVVVMVTAASDDETLFAALRAGAQGFLVKDRALGRLPQALAGVLEGEAAMPRDLTARVLAEFRRRGRSPRLTGAGRPRVGLTSREADVLELLHQGLETAEIGERLFLAGTTVRTHVSALLRKFGVRDREALLALLEVRERPLA